jgi:hypothetical protein
MLLLPEFDDQAELLVIRIYGRFGSTTGAARVAKKEVEAMLSFRLEPQNLVA